MRYAGVAALVLGVLGLIGLYIEPRFLNSTTSSMPIVVAAVGSWV